MKPKIMIARAIVALAILCALGAATYSLSSQGQAQQHICTASGYVVDTYGKGLPGLDVTLHVVEYDAPTGASKELYTLATKTSDTPGAGQFAFDQVRIPEGNVTAYTSTSTTMNGTTFYGTSKNYTLRANGSIPGSIVLKTWTDPEGPVPPMSILIEHIFDSAGNPLSGTNTRIHIMGRNESTGAIKEIYNQTFIYNETPTSPYDEPPVAGLFSCAVFVPTGVEYAYVESSVQDNDTTLYGCSDNFTIDAGGVAFANVTCAPSPTSKAIVRIPIPPRSFDMCTINGHVVDAHGNGVPGAGATLHLLLYNASSAASEELYNMSIKGTADGQDAGLFIFDSIVPDIPESLTLLGYVDVSIKKGDATYTGRSDNFTMKANDTVNLRIGIPLK